MSKDKNGDVNLIETFDIKSMIYTIRGQQVMLDSDLADLYGYEVKALNQQVKRNINRFPEDFMFQLTQDELSNLKSQNVTSSWGGPVRMRDSSQTTKCLIFRCLKDDTAITSQTKFLGGYSFS